MDDIDCYACHIHSGIGSDGLQDIITKTVKKQFIFIKPLMILRYLNRTTTTALRQQNIALIFLTMVTEEILRLHITGNAVQWKSY